MQPFLVTASSLCPPSPSSSIYIHLLIDLFVSFSLILPVSHCQINFPKYALIISFPYSKNIKHPKSKLLGLTLRPSRACACLAINGARLMSSTLPTGIPRRLPDELSRKAFKDERTTWITYLLCASHSTKIFDNHHFIFLP